MLPLRPGTYRTEPGEFYGTPKELWGFRKGGAGSPGAIARRFLGANRELLGLTGILGQLRERVRTVHSVGATHVICQQRWGGRRVHRAYVTVHVGAGNEVYLVKNRAMPKELLPPPRRRPAIRVAQAKAIVLKWLGVRESSVSPPLRHELLWYPWDDELVLAHKVRVHVPRRGRKQREKEWIVYLDASTGEILQAIDNLAQARGRGLVFNPNPVIALGGAAAVLTKGGHPVRRVPAAAYEIVSLRGLLPGRFLDGKRVTTRPTRRSVTGKRRIARKNRDYLVFADENGFEEVMAYYHLDEAIRYLEQLGYRGRRAIFHEPLPVNVSATRADQSWYSPGYRQINFGRGGGVNDAEDAETILHEFGHALQDFICPDFGQTDEAAAVGEGFGDYFALSFFADRKKHLPAYRTAVMSWDAIDWRRREPRCLRDIGTRKTFASFAPGLGPHENGRIWAAALWDIREALGRDVADRLIVESHFQLDGFTTFARAARAIVDADDNLYDGRHRSRLRGVFRARRIGPVHGPR